MPARFRSGERVPRNAGPEYRRRCRSLITVYPELQEPDGRIGGGVVVATQTARALDGAETLWLTGLAGTSSELLAQPSACDGWSVADLINHVIGGAVRYRLILEHADMEAIAATHGHDYLDGDPAAAFTAEEDRFRAVADEADLSTIVQHRVGPRTGRVLLDMRVLELTLHAHDLCRSVDVRWQPGDALLRYLLDHAQTVDELRAHGLYGPRTRPRSAAPADVLLALAGR